MNKPLCIVCKGIKQVDDAYKTYFKRPANPCWHQHVSDKYIDENGEIHLASIEAAEKGVVIYFHDDPETDEMTNWDVASRTLESLKANHYNIVYMKDSNKLMQTE